MTPSLSARAALYAMRRWAIMTKRSAHLVVTMGIPSCIYRWSFCAHGGKSCQHNGPDFVGIGPIHDTFIGTLEGRETAMRERWLARRGELARRGD